MLLIACYVMHANMIAHFHIYVHVSSSVLSSAHLGLIQYCSSLGDVDVKLALADR